MMRNKFIFGEKGLRSVLVVSLGGPLKQRQGFVQFNKFLFVNLNFNSFCLK